ncbi:MAG: prepilin-type N-terminal cleavage/methylation domain-containing protein [Planctomycetota bacterium]|nr:prepilin-type N-terminal cleavage/methylation domain-containing protein [Planctomycetota bacterium]MDI6787219.1 prepilin-type N-terminal cleavage/methylation domain-containing protein [Planctomycetota bacterium]
MNDQPLHLNGRVVRHLCAGLTLIEVLIAIIIMSIGLVSILAIFPLSIKTTRLSVEDTIAGKIAESVLDALNIAMRSAIPENIGQNQPCIVTLIHDGLPEGSYTFALPLPLEGPLPTNPLTIRPFAHPSDNSKDVSTRRPSPTDVFRLGGTDFIKSVLDDVRKGPDATDPYDQCGFTFTVTRVDDNRPPAEIGNNYKPRPLFQFAVEVYRLPPNYEKGKELPNPINVFVIQIAGK